MILRSACPRFTVNCLLIKTVPRGNRDRAACRGAQEGTIFAGRIEGADWLEDRGRGGIGREPAHRAEKTRKTGRGDFSRLQGCRQRRSSRERTRERIRPSCAESFCVVRHYGKKIQRNQEARTGPVSLCRLSGNNGRA